MCEKPRDCRSSAKIESLAYGSIEKSGVGLSQVLEQQQHAQILEQARQKGFVAGNPPQAVAQFPAGNRLGQRVLPIPQQGLGLDVQEQSAGQAESQNQQFQWLDPQQGQRLIEVRHLPAESEKRTIDHAKDSAGNGRIVFDALFQCPCIDVRVPCQLQNLHGNAGQAIKLTRPSCQMVQGRRGIDHAGLAIEAGDCLSINLAYGRRHKIRNEEHGIALAG